ncbi:MAG: hypothetical protein A2021_04240 [Elusimicrobia bacterium GWF2_52_66]|nr:MAG: hypothetical protein A2X33_04065 [Elusimicrobia bacterium GWA2_51_34]OGR85929.1 MAG: hypothetical protein A2021_04240 [Elusimicrobia bacterium GWF2_52_66]HAF96516.1 hypothetical protein [Elusimicrobiota bacterium]HCE97595.1 hypothetical protein [Elusimicrobiota bacterium]
MKNNFILACALCAAAAPVSAEMGSKYKVDFYGFLKTDFIYSDHGTSTNEYRTYTVSGRQDRAFRASARASRFGFNIDNGGNVAGKLEADFLGLTDSLAGAAGTVSDLRLRLAYITITSRNFEILAGQTYYVITADLPETINDYYLGNSGALWARAPQIRITYFPLETLKFQASVNRPTSKLTDAEGTHSALPGLQAKIEKRLGKIKLSFAGASGVWKSTSTQNEAEVQAVVAAFNAPFYIYTLYGEAWTGKNMSDFLGGLGNTGYGAGAVHSKGGYLAFKVKPDSDLWFSVMYGLDDPDNSKVSVNGKTKNSTALGNMTVRLYDSVETGFEAASLVTRYKGPDGCYNRQSMNYQLTFKLQF